MSFKMTLDNVFLGNEDLVAHAGQSWRQWSVTSLKKVIASDCVSNIKLDIDTANLNRIALR